MRSGCLVKFLLPPDAVPPPNVDHVLETKCFRFAQYSNLKDVGFAITKPSGRRAFGLLFAMFCGGVDCVADVCPMDPARQYVNPNSNQIRFCSISITGPARNLNVIDSDQTTNVKKFSKLKIEFFSSFTISKNRMS